MELDTSRDNMVFYTIQLMTFNHLFQTGKDKVFSEEIKISLGTKGTKQSLRRRGHRSPYIGLADC